MNDAVIKQMQAFIGAKQNASPSDMALWVKRLSTPTPDVVGGDVVICHRWVNGDERTDWFDADVLSAADVPRIEAMGFRLERAYAAPRVQGDALRNYEELNREFSNGFELGKSLNGSVANGSIVTDEMITAAKLAFYSGGSHTLSAEREHIRRALEAALAAQPKGDDVFAQAAAKSPKEFQVKPHPAEQTRGEPLIVPHLPHGSDRNPLPDFSSFRPAIDEFVNRFLSWELPDDVCADPVACKPSQVNRYGTNLLTHNQAKLMVEHVFAETMKDGWFAGTEDADGNELVSLRADDPRLSQPKTEQTRGEPVVERLLEAIERIMPENYDPALREPTAWEVDALRHARDAFVAARQAVPDGWPMDVHVALANLSQRLSEAAPSLPRPSWISAHKAEFWTAGIESAMARFYAEVEVLDHEYRKLQKAAISAAPSAGRMGVDRG